MDSSGRAIANVHNGDTFINGSLTVQEQILVGDAEGKSEYLDSGNYTPTITSLTAGWSFSQSSPTTRQAWYVKNGNIVSIGINMSASWVAPTTTVASFRITVPALDIFEQKLTNQARSTASILGRYTIAITNKSALLEDSYDVVFNAVDFFTVSSSTSFQLLMTYKLEGEDKPATAIISGGGGSGGDVRNPMIENLDGGGFNISNVDTLTVNNIVSSGLVSNPLTAPLDVNNSALLNVSLFSGSGGETKFGGDRLIDVSEVSNSANLLLQGGNDAKIQSFGGLMDLPSSGFALFEGVSKATILSPIVDLSATIVLSQGDLQMNDNKITSCAELASANGDLIIKGLTTGGTFPANILFEGFAVDLSQCPSGLNMGTHRIDDCSEIIGTAGSGLRLDGVLIDCKTDLNMNENKIFQLGFIENAGIDLDITSNIGLNGNLNMSGNNITNAPSITNTGGINITAGLTPNSNISITSSPTGQVTIGNSCSHNYISQSGTERKIVQRGDRLELDNSSGSVETIHIYDANGFFEESTINEGGFDFYQLQDNITYVIHGDVTVTQGFKFGINNVIKGESLSASITFDETTSNIIGFKAVDQNLVISHLTVYGGGGHFSNSPVGLFIATNFNTGATAPFYGRNKRFFIDTCNIFFPFSLGSVRGFGTSNILSSFFNGGGGSPSGIYTNFGLSIADGLSCEIRGNKFVLFKGAQALSTLKMINFADATLTPVVLGFNAVNVVSNIIHPRDEETGIDFSENSLTKLGVISGNTFIRTGGFAPLINYQRADEFDNYNVKAIETYEISGNIGVIDSEPVLECSCGINNSVSSATYIDLDIPITSINPLSMSKRFAYKFVATGVSGGGGAYTKGNYLVSVTDTTKYGYIVDVETVLAGTDILYIVDMTGIFPNLTNYKEQDAGLVDTGVTSTGLDIGDNSNNIELYYFDKDPHDIQFAIQINYQTDSKEDEIQFRLEIDTGAGYVEVLNSEISTFNAKTGRTTSTTLVHLKRMEFGNLIKLTTRYIDTTNIEIQSVNYTGK
ncbi:hypothetical protein N9231_05010 [Saprospiraceae bacterium]|nr:hypothetical protein [Saprospiraceae bacterium]